MHIKLTAPQHTETLARRFACYIENRGLLALSGGLGAGKTTFARAFIRERLGDDHATIPSPSFSLVQYYETPGGPIAHADLYRIDNPVEINELGLLDAVTEGLCLLEWPEKMATELGSDRIDVRFDGEMGTLRIATITASGCHAGSVQALLDTMVP